MKKRKLLLGSLLAIAALTFTSCVGNNPSKTSSTTGTQPTGAPTTTVVPTTSTKAPTTTPAPTTTQKPTTPAPTTTQKPTTPAPTTTTTTTITVAKTLLGINIPNSSAHKTVFVINEEFTYDGLTVNAIFDVDGETVVEKVTDYTVTVADSEGNALEGTTLTKSGTFTVTVAYEGAKKTYEITVEKEQYKFTKTFPVSLCGATENKTYTDTEVETLIDNEDVKVTIEGSKSKLQVTDSNGNSTAHLHDGVMYDYRVQVNTSKSFVKVTAARDAKLTLLGSGQVDGQNRAFILKDAEGTTYQSVLQMNDENTLSVNTFEIKGGEEYSIYSSYNGINIYAFILEFSVDADTVEDNKDIQLAGYETEFTTTGDTTFNVAAPQGLVVNSLNNYGVPTALAAEAYTVTVTAKDDTTPVTEITTPGTYTVTVAITGTELTASYDVTITNPNATITKVDVVTSDDTDKLFYGTDVLTTEGLSVSATDSDNLVKSLEAADYTVHLALNGYAVEGFTVSSDESNVYTVVITYGGVEGTYEVKYYAVKETVINTSKIKTKIAVGATAFINDAYVETIYEDNSSVKLAATVTYAFYSDEACTASIADAATAFAAEGTVYAKFESEGYTAVVLPIQVAVISTEEFLAADLGEGTAVQKDSEFYTGTWFTLTYGSAGAATVTKGFTAAANDASGLTFDTFLLPGGGSRTVKVTANEDITITVYFSSGDSKFNTTEGAAKSGELTVDGVEVETVAGNKSNAIAYAYTMTLTAGKTVELGLTANRFVLYGIIASK